MSISFFGISGSTPDSAVANSGYSNTSGNTPVPMTQPPSMLSGDLCICNVAVNGSGAGKIQGMNSGDGQTWHAGNYYTGNGHGSQIFWCQFNGTWVATPSFVPGGGTSTGGVSGVLNVFRSSLGAAAVWAVDSNCAEVDSNSAAPGSPFNATIAGQSPVSTSSLTWAWWFDGATLVTYSLQTAGWLVPGSNNQWRNVGHSSGQLVELAFAYLINTAAGATGSVTNRQSAGSSFAGNIITFTDGSTPPSTTPYIPKPSGRRHHTIFYP